MRENEKQIKIISVKQKQDHFIRPTDKDMLETTSQIFRHIQNKRYF